MIRRWFDRTPQGCLDDGTLRLLIDAPAQVTPHVAHCAICALRLENLRADAAWARDALQTTATGDAVDVRRAWRSLGQRVATLEEGAMMEPSPALWQRGALRLATASVAVVALLAVFTLTPMRTVADDMLARFRVEKFAVVTIPMDLVAPFQSAFLENMDDLDSAAWEEQFAELGAFTTTFNMNSAREVGSLDEARAIHGDFDVPDDDALPDGFGADPAVYVSDPGSATYELNTAAAQEIIDEIGLPIYALPDPADYPTLTFELDAPSAVGLLYTDSQESHLLVAEMESPTITFPEGLDMDELREEILRFPGLPPDLVAQLRAIDDWEHTLIIPIPEGAESRDVTVNGEPGLLIEGPDEGSAVLWEEDGVLHLVAGQADEDALLDVANSLD